MLVCNVASARTQHTSLAACIHHRRDVTTISPSPHCNCVTVCYCWVCDGYWRNALFVVHVRCILLMNTFNSIDPSFLSRFRSVPFRSLSTDSLSLAPLSDYYFYRSRGATHCDQCVCLFIGPLAYLKNHMSNYHQIFCTCHLWPRLGPPLKAMQ